MRKIVEILGEETVWDGFFRMRRLRLRHSSFEGGWCAPVFRERLENSLAHLFLCHHVVVQGAVGIYIAQLEARYRGHAVARGRRLRQLRVHGPARTTARKRCW